MKTLVFDTNPFIYKGKRMKPNSKVGGVDHFLDSFVQCVQKTQPTKVICLIDPPGISWRAQVFAEYKLHRKRDASQLLLREAVREQLEMLKKVLAHLPVSVCIHNGYEADDLAYWMTQHVAGKLLLVTIDRDWLQLCSKTVSVFLFDKNISVNLTNFQDTDVPQKPAGIRFNHYLLYKAIVGDNSDGLKGIDGIGPKKAVAYLTAQKEMTDDEWNVVRRNLLLMDLSKTPYTESVDKNIEKQLAQNEFSRTKLKSIVMELGLLKHFNQLCTVAEQIREV